jgi:hypothetical protein
MKKLDRKLLERLIREELTLFLEVNPNHSKKDGKFAKKKAGNVYSLTKNAEDDVADDSELEVPARGVTTSKGTVGSKYGSQTGSPEKQCGRLTIDGDKKPKTRRCRDYPKNYWNEGEEREVVAPNLNSTDEVYMKALIQREVEQALRGVMNSKALKKKGGCSWEKIMFAVRDIATAEKGRKDEA